MMSSIHRAAARSAVRRSVLPSTAHFSSGEKGSGVGHGGGAGGAIRESGGAFGKRSAAQEEQYFRQKQAEQLHLMKTHLTEEIQSHEKLIKQHEEAIRKSKEKIQQLEHQDK